MVWRCVCVYERLELLKRKLEKINVHRTELLQYFNNKNITVSYVIRAEHCLYEFGMLTNCNFSIKFCNRFWLTNIYHLTFLLEFMCFPKYDKYFIHFIICIIMFVQLFSGKICFIKVDLSKKISRWSDLNKLLKCGLL